MFNDIPGYLGYQIDESGVCRSSNRLGCRVLRPLRLKNGYLVYNLYVKGVDGKCGRYHTRYIHHLVLEVFVGHRPHGMECRHLDGNRDNNHVSNLKWGTKSENSLDRVRHGTQNQFWKRNSKVGV